MWRNINGNQTYSVPAIHTDAMAIHLCPTCTTPMAGEFKAAVAHPGFAGSMAGMGQNRQEFKCLLEHRGWHTTASKLKTEITSTVSSSLRALLNTDLLDVLATRDA